MIRRNNKLIPSSIFLFILFTLIFFFSSITTIIINIIDLDKKRDIWEYAINLSLNYIEKIPKVIELGLSTSITIIFGTTNISQYYKKEEYPQYQQKYMTYFTKMKNYENSDLISSNIKDSLFANKLYDNYRIKKNIEFCEKDIFFQQYFQNSKLLNKKLNVDNYFCINSSVGSLLLFNKWITTLETFYVFVDQMAVACKLENEKINDSGLDLEIALILHELTYLYNDYEEKIIFNITYAREKFFENENFYRMLRDLNVPFTFAASSLFSSIKEDMNQINNKISDQEIIFIIITYFIYILFL